MELGSKNLNTLSLQLISKHLEVVEYNRVLFSLARKAIESKDGMIRNLKESLSINEQIISSKDKIIQAYKDNEPAWYDNFLIGALSGVILIGSIFLLVGG